MDQSEMNKKKKKKTKIIPPSQFARVYYTPSHPSSYRGAKVLSHSVPGSTEKQALEWLQGQDTYTLHRAARKTLVNDPIIVSGIDDQWEADLIDVQNLASLNKGYRFLLTVIDTLSKFAWVIPIKDKTGKSTSEALAKIFKKGRIPRYLRTDSGKEFENRTLQVLLKKNKVHHFTAKNRTKAAVVERFNRTIRSRLWKYFYATGKQRYVDVLDEFVRGYNSAIHSTTKAAPDSITPYNGESIWRRMYGHLLKKKKKPLPKYKVGDIVRISKAKGTFEKGYITNWTEELFIVKRVITGGVGRDRYEIKDFQEEPIYGTFKPEELQKIKVTKPKEIKKTVKRTASQKAVQWRGYPDDLITWIDL